jgi:hypothetical protein
MPPDKAILEELQDILNDDNVKIPSIATNRLLLAGILSLKNQVSELNQTQLDCADAIKKALEPVKKNPAFILGEFIYNHPKASVAILAFFLFLSNIWFIDDFRIAVLTWLKVPAYFINLLH